MLDHVRRFINRQDELGIRLENDFFELPYLPRYQNEVFFEDFTTGYHIGRIILQHDHKPLCGYMDLSVQSNIMMFQCNKHLAHTYLCEFEGPSRHTAEVVRTLTIARLSEMWLVYLNASLVKTFATVICPRQHVTHAFLACDLSSDCWLEENGGHSARGRVKCSAPLRPLPPSFGCREKGQYVPYTLVCDHRQDCFGGTDEEFCVFSSGNMSDTHGAFLCLGDSPFQCGRTNEV